MTETEQLAALKEFARRIIRDYAWQYGDPDGGNVQEKAVECGLLLEEPYDPEKHGESECDPEPGDQWFVFPDWLKEPKP
jgi:hypothetical protein